MDDSEAEPIAKEASRRAYETIRRWPPGMTVYHNSGYRRGVIIAHLICPDGAVMAQVNWGDTTQNHYPFELRREKIVEGLDA